MDWAIALEKLSNEMGNTPDATTVGRILALFGGMGSLNDLILCKNNVPLVKENNEFGALRSRLYDLCHKKQD